MFSFQTEILLKRRKHKRGHQTLERLFKEERHRLLFVWTIYEYTMLEKHVTKHMCAITQSLCGE